MKLIELLTLGSRVAINIFMFHIFFKLKEYLLDECWLRWNSEFKCSWRMNRNWYHFVWVRVVISDMDFHVNLDSSSSALAGPLLDQFFPLWPVLGHLMPCVFYLGVYIVKPSFLRSSYNMFHQYGVPENYFICSSVEIFTSHMSYPQPFQIINTMYYIYDLYLAAYYFIFKGHILQLTIYRFLGIFSFLEIYFYFPNAAHVNLFRLFNSTTWLSLFNLIMSMVIIFLYVLQFYIL